MSFLISNNCAKQAEHLRKAQQQLQQQLLHHTPASDIITAELRREMEFLAAEGLARESGLRQQLQGLAQQASGREAELREQLANGAKQVSSNKI